MLNIRKLIVLIIAVTFGASSLSTDLLAMRNNSKRSRDDGQETNYSRALVSRTEDNNGTAQLLQTRRPLTVDYSGTQTPVMAKGISLIKDCYTVLTHVVEYFNPTDLSIAANVFKLRRAHTTAMNRTNIPRGIAAANKTNDDE